ncbi:MAG: 4-alpha-glucanotransferase, partial [Candidatus Omnitrophica bacterium]|nr:4-alpha-glucanotransferase [Candidatus Omnitrophota bacterium]
SSGLKSPEFKNFIKDNSYWLDDFALFKVLKAGHGGKPWYEWEEGYQLRDGDALDIVRRDNADEISFHKWVQWQVYIQFCEAKRYAASKGVFLKGDLPILISRDSADVWAHPEFFKLDVSAGAPPDMYCAKGQRWGMPTYNWENIQSDGYRYHKEKLKYARNFYDILRVDHVVGLFRIWSIPVNDPAENIGLNGYFDPKDESLWEEHGKKILSMVLENTDMLMCAEDLGIIPKACTDTLKEYGMPGNEVQRWVKDWSLKHDFLEPDGYRKLAVAMLSTHDTTNWAAWWENEAGTVDEALFIRKCADRGIDYERVKTRLFDPKLSRRGRLRWNTDIRSKDAYIEMLGKRPEELMDFIDLYENSYKEKEKLWKHLGLKGSMRERSDSEIVGAALGITMSSASVFCIELIFDRLFLAGIIKGDPYLYRVNTPGTVNRSNWSLTIPAPLEDIMSLEVWSGIKSRVEASGRG